ncbi:AraC family transcriptional regulator [Sphingobium sp. JS3065]|uniref:helix-turn-helix transcriptional regulator n=1 Tax=Sphingobium sp. JS3065 TaxID=2970925 RepID=UPI0022642F38|nr:AraC family transcriptional regulator [Sphingobium sp. JS3065]UZW57236.1 AraC family transcriptional regulator [Sphingobium sp. JS3065]
MTVKACHISASMGVDDVNVQLIDYKWSANEQISECENRYILRYRPDPRPISVAAHLKHGRLQTFGQLMFFPACTAVETTPAKASERSRSIVCMFDYEWFRRISFDRDDWNDNDLAECYDMKNFSIEQAVRRLGMEAECPGFASHLMVESLAQSVAVDLARHFLPGGRAKRVRTQEGRLSLRELNRIYDYVESVVNRSPTTEEISKQCGISSAHLRRSFKHSTGDTLHQYVTNVRLRKARSLLAESDLPLKEVAYRLGFASSSTFSSTFRKISGETPSGFRTRLQN